MIGLTTVLYLILSFISFFIYSSIQYSILYIYLYIVSNKYLFLLPENKGSYYLLLFFLKKNLSKFPVFSNMLFIKKRKPGNAGNHFLLCRAENITFLITRKLLKNKRFGTPIQFLWGKVLSKIYSIFFLAKFEP